MPFRHRHRLWIVLIALSSLLFQQFALARHLCLGSATTAMTPTATVESQPPCHAPAAPLDDDALRCAQHCSASTPAPDHVPMPSVPALLPVTVWPLPLASVASLPRGHLGDEILARATAPPLNIRDCSFQI